MKLKYIHPNPDADMSVALVNQLVDLGVIDDYENQVLGIYDNEIQLDNVALSDELTKTVNEHEGWQIQTDPRETKPFEPEQGLSDVDKVGSVPSPIYENEDESELENYLPELFPVSEFEDSVESGEVDQNIVNKDNQEIMKREQFNDPALDENGVAIQAKENEVKETVAEDKENFTPDAGGFDGPLEEPFTEEEIQRGNDVHVELDENDDVKVFSEGEEVENPDELEKVAEDIEEENKTFAEHKKRLYAAKRRLKKAYSLKNSRKSFAEELSEKETSEVIEDIVAILEDAPEIREAVAKEVDELNPEVREEVKTEAECPECEEAKEETPETFNEETKEEEVEETKTETEPAKETEEKVEDENKDTFSEEVEEQVTEEVTEEPTEEEVAEATGEIFCKTFSEDNVSNFRRKVLNQMAQNIPSGRR